ncbi:MAG: ectonucleotide pyrophosphatase/phosphodiesterase [Defluviitaleaceae bacterium]|nr:ectonucleotide pyrophosphatase/phosphodiesterase [Defluviitaleaceae bacterium]
MPILVISFDGVGDIAYEKMAANAADYPNIAALKRDGYYKNAVSTVFLSSTYPIHATVSTGKLPKDHGIISNYADATRSDDAAEWAQMANMINGKTIWDCAKQKRLKTAAFLWPVSCGAKIDYHIPEYHKQAGENQIICNLKYGSKLFQLKTFLKYKHLLDGIKQPNLDNFTTAAVCNLLDKLDKTEKNPKKNVDLVLVHLIAYDDFCHRYGNGNTQPAQKALDENLGKLLKSWGNKPVIVFSDHSQLDVAEVVNLENILPDTFVQNGGSAFLKNAKILEDTEKSAKIDGLQNQPWFGRFLTSDELAESGQPSKLGIAAKVGYSFGNKPLKGDHGYPSNYENFQIFYNTINTKKNISHSLKGTICDVTAIIAHELQLDMEILDEYGLR